MALINSMGGSRTTSWLSLEVSILSLLLRCKDPNSTGTRGIMRVWWKTHQTIEYRLIVKSSSCETSARSG